MSQEAENTQEEIQEQEVQKYTLEEAQSLLLESEDFISSIPLEKFPNDKLPNIEKVKADYTAEIYGKAKKKIRGEFGLSDAEMAEISEEDKSDFYKFLSKGKEIYDARKGNVVGDADKLLKENGELLDKIDAMQTSHQTAIEQAVNAERDKANSQVFDFKLEQKIFGYKDNIPAVNLVAPSLVGKLKEKYDLRFEEGGISFYEKGKEFKVKHPERNGAWLDLEAALKSSLGSEWIEPKATTTATTTTLITPIKGGKFNNQDLAKKWGAE